MASDKCRIGIFLDEECHKHTYCRKSGLIALSDLKPVDRWLLSWCCGVIFGEEDNICFHHEKVYLTRFEKSVLIHLFITRSTLQVSHLSCHLSSRIHILVILEYKI